MNKIENEKLAQETLMNKQLLYSYEMKRQSNIEALQALNDKRNHQTQWMMTTDNFFIQLEKNTLKEVIKNDQTLLEQEIKKIKEHN